MDHGVGNWTATNITLPMHLVMLPNESLSSGVNFMMDNTVGHVPGLEEPRDTFLKSGVEYEAHSDSSDTCQHVLKEKSLQPLKLESLLQKDTFFFIRTSHQYE